MRKGTRGLLAVVLVGLSVGLTGCIPTSPTGNWSLVGGDQRSNTSGSTPGVVLVGDSLVYTGSGVQSYADTIRFFTGRSAVVSAAGGASYSHYTHSGLLGPGLSTIQDLTGLLKPAVTVIALGTNDGRLLGLDLGNPNGYTESDFQQSAATAINAARAPGGCVVVVNATTRPQTQDYYEAAVPKVNSYLQTLVDTNGGRVRLADWNAFSAGHDEWFDAADGDQYHHSAAGKNAYRQFIVDATVSAFQAGC